MKNLNRLYWIKKEIRQIEEQLKELTILSSVPISDMPKGSTSIASSVEQFAERLIILKSKLEDKRLEYVNERIRLEEVIGGIDDAEVSLIARMRYIDNYSWEHIGNEMNMDRTTVAKKVSRYMRGCVK